MENLVKRTDVLIEHKVEDSVKDVEVELVVKLLVVQNLVKEVDFVEPTEVERNALFQVVRKDSNEIPFAFNTELLVFVKLVDVERKKDLMDYVVPVPLKLVNIYIYTRS